MISITLKGSNGAEFETTLLRWRAICRSLAQFGYNPPRAWIHPEAIVRADTALCQRLAASMERALARGGPSAAEEADIADALSAEDEPAEETVADRAHFWSFLDFVESCGGFRGELTPVGGLPLSRPWRGAVPEAVYRDKMFR